MLACQGKSNKAEQQVHAPLVTLTSPFAAPLAAKLPREETALQVTSTLCVPRRATSSSLSPCTALNVIPSLRVLLLVDL